MPETIRFGRYVLDRRLAIGGMAEVFLGHAEGPRGFEKRVVLKRLLPHLLDDKHSVSMFLDEARVAAHFRHPNVVQVHDLAEQDGQYCLSMEYIEGDDLAILLDACHARKLRIPPHIVAHIIAEAADGLHYVHTLSGTSGTPLNIVHRDVSPANIVVTRNGPVKVVDFGIAKSTASTEITKAGVLKGKYAYMSPEQVQGLPLDARSDIFSLGIVLYELLTTKRCFTGTNPYEILEAVSRVDFVPADIIRPNIPEPLIDLLRNMLTGNRNARYKTANDVAKHLRLYLAETTWPSSADLTPFIDRIMGRTTDTNVPPRRCTTAVGSDIVPVDDTLAAPEISVGDNSHQSMLNALVERERVAHAAGAWQAPEAGGPLPDGEYPTPAGRTPGEYTEDAVFAALERVEAVKQNIRASVAHRPWLPVLLLLGAGLAFVAGLYAYAITR